MSTYENIFDRSPDDPGKIIQLPIEQLHPFPDHPFHIRDDESMRETVASIRAYGVLVPIIVRPREDGDYEIVSGHRRKHACELAGLDNIPAIVQPMDDDTATIILVDSNLQRDEILPCERGAAYKMKIAAVKRQGARNDLTSRQVVGKSEAADLVGEAEEMSGRQVQRFIRLTELSPELQQLVDDKQIGLTPAVALSYLSPTEQALLVDTIDSEQATPSLSQALRMKRLSENGQLNEDTILEIMTEQKKTPREENFMPGSRLRQYFPYSYTSEHIEAIILKLLETWAANGRPGQDDSDHG